VTLTLRHPRPATGTRRASCGALLARQQVPVHHDPEAAKIFDGVSDGRFWAGKSDRKSYRQIETPGLTESRLLSELGFNSDWIEKCLAHEDSRSSRGVYNNAEYEVQQFSAAI
jgi:hypothetical protein